MRAPSGRPLRTLAIAVSLGAAVVAWAPAPAAAADPSPAPSAPAPAPAPAPAFAAGDPLPACTTADDPAPFRRYGEWASTLVDTRFALPRAYAPPDLVSTSNAGTNGGYLVRRLVIADLRAMVRAAAAAGVRIRVDSGYRSYARQAAVYAYYVDLLGPVKGALRAARPGHSEHQLGTAMDIRNTAGAYTWLARHGWKYGFVISFPKGMTSISCYQYEPWHIRYYGRTRAIGMHWAAAVPRAWLWAHVVAV